MKIVVPTTKTARLLHSFQSVELRPEHRNHGDEGPYLRDFGFAPVVAAKLVAWGEREDLVCWFENSAGRSDGRHSWKPEFLIDACTKHLELYGPGDLTDDFIAWSKMMTERRDVRSPDRQRG